MLIPKYLIQYRKDLEFKNYSENSISNYESQVRTFLNYFNGKFTEPAKINETAIKDWIMLGNSINSRKHRISALKLFYVYTIKQPLKFRNIDYPRSDKKLPIVLSVDEIQAMFNACENTKHKTILALLYSCGFRVSELINLRWSNIDRKRMIINVLQAKGKKDRQVPLPKHIIPLLEKYYFEFKPQNYVFNGQNGSSQYSETSVLQVVKQLAEKAGIKKRVYTHLIRHCFATHNVENGTDINLLQKILGHSNVKTTNMYLHISDLYISKINSPINQINL